MPLIAAVFFCVAVPAGAQTVPPAAPCNQISGITGSIVTCSGNLSSGVNLTNGSGPYQVLNVDNLTADIAPTTGIAGIVFSSNGSVELNVGTGPWSIVTTDAPAIFAQSGTGNVNVRSFATITTYGNSAAGISTLAAAGDVNIFSAGNITTHGAAAYGISAGANDSVTVTSHGNITTSGASAFGIMAQGITGSATVESTGDIVTSGANSDGINAEANDSITVTSHGNITTSGASAFGIHAESMTGSVTVESTGDIVASGGQDGGGIFVESNSGAIDILSTGSITITGGLAGIYAGTGGAATVISTGSVHTIGVGNAGIAVMGLEGVSVTSLAPILTEDDNSPAITLRADTGAIRVRSGGSIRTAGELSHGIDAISSLGSVNVVSTSNIRTIGADADGISAVTSGSAVVESRGNISATGDGSVAIRVAGYAGSQILNYGNALGGLCACSGGVDMMSVTGDNTLINFGSIAALSELAIHAENAIGNNMVENYGTVTGNVELIGGASAVFTNHAGALFNTADYVDAEIVANHGTIAPGGRGRVRTTLISNDFVQGVGGTYAVDLNPAGAGLFDRNDALVVFNTARVDGNVRARVLSLPRTAVQSFTILTAMGGLSHGDVNLIASPALHARLAYPNANDMVLGIAVDFDANGLNGNQRSIAGSLNRVLFDGPRGVDPVLLGLLNVDDLGQYRGALDQLSPEVYSDAEIAALYSSLAFSNSLMSCKVNGTDTASIIREGQCLWAGASARFLDTGTTSEQIGFTETAGLFTAGAQVALDDVWRLGVAGGYQSSSVSTATGATSEGNLGQAGVALKYNPGPLLIAGGITGGGAHYDTRRTMSFGGFTGSAEGDQNLGIFSGALRAAYVLGSPHLYFKPSLDANLTRIELDSFTEAGGAAALSVEGQGHTVFSLAPMVETGTEFWLGNGTLVRPLIRAGAIWYDNADLALTAAFAGAPGVSPFTINTGIDEVMGLVGAGIDVINGNEAVLRLSYDGQLGETTQIHAVGIKGSARF